MAEIKVEKKKPIWPWIIVGLIILVILYFLFFTGDDDAATDDTFENEQIQDTTYQETQRVGTTTWEQQRDTMGQGSIDRYISHVGDQSRMGVDHEYTNNALIHLMNAVQAKANELDVNIDADMEQIRQEAQEITRNPQSTNHANKIKSAGSRITDVLENLQKEEFPDLSNDVQEVRTAVEEIDPSVQTLQQRDKINRFFNEAAEVLRNMNS